MKAEFLQEGDVIEIKKGMRVYTMLPEHFVYANTFGSWRLAKHDVTVGQSIGGLNTGFLAGKYVVTKTAQDGGGTGMGPHDVYPDGHHVFATRFVNNEPTQLKIDFYQSGCFTAMIEAKDIQPVGKAKVSYKL